jgi:hypothetical protein
VVFKLSKQQLAERKVLAADLRKQAEALNTAIVALPLPAHSGRS